MVWELIGRERMDSVGAYWRQSVEHEAEVWWSGGLRAGS